MQVMTVGADGGRGNLLGVEPWLTVGDYRSAAGLEARLDECLCSAREAGLLSERTVAVFPEYIGAWLVAADEPAQVFRAATAAAAMRIVATRRPVSYLLRLLSSRAQDRATESLFRLKAPGAATAYQRVFSSLARRHRISIVAGSIILPQPRVARGALCPGPGPLANVSVVFGPDGEIIPDLVRKCHPTEEETRFLRGGAPQDLPSFKTSAGRLGVLVCADSWFPDCWARMGELGVEMVAVVSFSQGHGAWALPWKGYSGAGLPPDVDPADVGTITEADAWRKYALAGRIGSSGVCHGINVFLRGELWDLGAEGATTVVHGSEVSVENPAPDLEAEGVRAGTLVSCWL